MRSLLVTVAVLAIAVPLVAGCGGGGSSTTTSSTNGTAASATEWAGGFCNAFSTWTSALKAIGKDVQNPTKENLQSAGDKIESANEGFADDLKSLGKPDLPRAQEAKNVVDDLADQIKATSDTISQTLSNVSTVSDIAQAAASVSTSLVNLQSEVQDTVSQLKSIDKTDSLKDAFNNASACKALQSSS